MIETITIANTATFGSSPQVLSDLSQFNFLYGSNATGKTTISRVIADASLYPSCRVAWKGGTKLQTMVYNHDFVDRNFHQQAELKGIFTLGEKQKDTLANIATAKMEHDLKTVAIENLTRELEGIDGVGGKKGELTTLEARLRDKCWAHKQRHDAKFQRAFTGHRSSKDAFTSKVLQELANNTSTLCSLANLEKRAESVFCQIPSGEVRVALLDATKLLAHESNPILKKRVIGKDDVDIAAMIKKLGNSDWVRQGQAFHNVNNDVCPFCQQSTTEAFAQSLSEYFDETFVTDSEAIAELVTNYSTDATRFQQQVAAIIAEPSKFLNVEKLKAEKELLDTKIVLNNQRLAGKKKEASQVVELESLSNIVATLTSLTDSANAQVDEHNKMVANLATERRTLTAQVWKFVLEELKADLVAFKMAKDGLEKAITNMTSQIEAAKLDRERTAAAIRELEKQTTSVQPTIDGINSLLSSFGFQTFSLAKAADGTSYRLVRPDGTDAKATLSESEKTFVTFLYFYYLLKGSESVSGMTVDRIVVFDDPVSSLDSDVLFIVGSLIRALFDEVRAGTGHIKQIFVLTHNVYFHKEVTYNSRRKDVAMKEETFWIVRKLGSLSKVEKHQTNPIKTSYELLWAEVRKADRSNLGIQNTLRRILENYFKILGGTDFDELCALFEGKEKLICKSLCSWVHAGSHNAHDDIYVSVDDVIVEAYLKVFRAIFDKSGHSAHYRMMMGDVFVDEAAETSPT